MSKINEEFVTDLANKLLIGLSEEEKSHALNTLENVDLKVELMDAIDNIKDVEPMTHTLDGFEYVLREDIVEENPSIEDLLKNCDDTDGREVVVPKVIG